MRVGALFLAVFSVLSMTACGGGGGGGDGGGDLTPQNIQGTWSALETITSTSCSGVGNTLRYAVSISQDGSVILFATPVGRFAGSVEGTVALIAGEGYDTVSQEYYAITNADLDLSGGQITGSVNWETRAVAGGPALCTGTSSLAAQRAYPPGPPLDLKASAMDFQSIGLTWLNDPAPRDGMRVLRGTTPENINDTVAELSGGETSYPDTGLTPETTYYYRLQSFNLLGSSPLSNIASTTTPARPVVPIPSAPSGLYATTIASTQVVLAWTDNSNNEAGFRVQKMTGGSATVVGKAGMNATSILLSGLLPGRTYQYRVVAVNSVWEASPPSNTISVMMPDTLWDDAWSLAIEHRSSSCGVSFTQTIFSAVRVTFPTDTTITITTSDGTLTGTYSTTRANVHGTLEVQRSPSPLPININSSTLITSADKSGMEGTVRWQITTPVACSGIAYVTMTRPLSSSTAPAAPSNPSVVVAGSRALRLFWTDNSSDEAGFGILRGPDAGSLVPYAQVAANVSSFGDSPLNPLTTYFYRVAAYNAAGESTPTSTVSGTTLAVPLLTAPSSAGPAFTLTWTFAWPETWANWDGYSLEEATPNDPSNFTGIFSDYLLYSPHRASPKSYSVSGKSAGTWRYRVRAYVSGAMPWSDYSNTVAVSVSQSPLPSAPSNLRVEPLGTTGARLIWNDNSNNEAGFKVTRWFTGSIVSSEVASLGPGVVTWDDSGLISTITYYYKVKSFNAGGSSEASNTATLTFPVAGGTFTFTPSYDNTMVGNTGDPTVNARVYGSQDVLDVGTIWPSLFLLDPWSGTTTYWHERITSRSLIRFDLGSIAGRTVTRATLKLWPSSLPMDYQNLSYQACRVTADWNPATVCGDTVMHWDCNAAPSFEPPNNTTIPVELDVTAIVQGWVSGSSANYGFFLWDPQGLDDPHPYNLDTFYFRLARFHSKEATSSSVRPTLVVEVQ